MKTWHGLLGIVSALLIAIASFWATLAVGQGHGRTGHGGRGPHCMRGLMRWLNLSEEQTTHVYDADPGFSENALKLRRELDAARETLANLLEDAGSSDEAVLDQIEKVVGTQSQLERCVAEHLLKIRKILTPDQRKQLFKLAATGVRGHGKGRGRRERLGLGLGRGQTTEHGGRRRHRQGSGGS